MFDQPVDNLPLTLTHTTGNYFNQPVDKLPPTGDMFHKPVNKLSPTLTIRRYFNQPT
jgi:hypothetical protein